MHISCTSRVTGHYKDKYLADRTADMEKQMFFAWTLTVLLSLLFAKQASGSFFSSLQFSRDALMDFSRGSQRTVDITLEPKRTTRIVNKTYVLILSQGNSISKTSLGKVDESVMKTAIPGFSTIPSDTIKASLDPSMRKDLPKDLLVTLSHKSGVPEPIILVPVKEKVIIKQTKREVYKSRTSPSNKFMKAINDIELAEANANALGVKYSYATLAKLKGLVEKAIQSKSYIYARQVRYFEYYLRIGIT